MEITRAEFFNSDENIKKEFSLTDFDIINDPLSDLLISCKNANEDTPLKVAKKHCTNYDIFHRMRREFRNRNRYWAFKLSPKTIKEKIQEGKNKFPKSEMIYLKFTFKNNRKAKFTITPVANHEFADKLSCLSECLLNYLLKENIDIYITKGVAFLKNIDKNGNMSVNGKVYESISKKVAKKVIMLKCKKKEKYIDRSLPNLSEEDLFDYYDVVHDPDNPPNKN